ncbi:hypothetical protein MUK42_36420 [Musa troglodytarum]|uniref:Uncharacterized protein n=1 Tax=Musa troglodytarum TaxID=320322 RepID=A0A9E7HJ91_9LILI|nr:hypothetical protein MUK42_36420 [Musa troglodytarum]
MPLPAPSLSRSTPTQNSPPHARSNPLPLMTYSWPYSPSAPMASYTAMTMWTSSG